MGRQSGHVPSGDRRRRWYAPASPEFRAESGPTLHAPYEGPRTPAEWDAAFAEMYANDPTFREWRSAELTAELAAKTAAATGAGDPIAAVDERAA